MSNMEQNKFVRGVAALVVIVLVFFAGNYMGQRSSATSAYTTIATPSDLGIKDEQFSPYWKVWRILTDKYVGATSTDREKRIWGSIEGLAASQGDPYTVFFPPEESAMFKSDISGNFEGVGMEIGLKEGILTVIAPIKNSPAERAGIRTGDRIIKIDGESTMDLPVDKAVRLIRGERNTVVKITIVPEGSNEQVEKSITRDVIDIPTLETEVKTGKSVATGGTGLRSDGIFVIRLFSFTAQAPDLFRNALREFVKSGSHKMIIDLRGNPGGYLDAAWDMGSWFLPAGKVIVTEDFGGKDTNKVYRSKGYNIFNNNLQLIILVDGGSASASEIFAGALQEHGIARLIGTKTFGKGSVQELIPITSDTSLKVTIASWLTPNGHNLSHDGLVPDVEVKLTAKDIESKKDLQIEKAVEILRAKP